MTTRNELKKKKDGKLTLHYRISSFSEELMTIEMIQ